MRIFALLILVALGAALAAEPIKSIEFRNQDIKDILLSLGELNKVSVVPDETVDGKASYVFANMEFQQALQTFLDTFHLSYVIKSNVYYISKINVSQNSKGALSVSAFDVPVRALIKILSTQIGKTILYDNLPADPVTINVSGATIEEVLGILIAKYPDFKLEVQDKFFYLRLKPAGSATTGAPLGDGTGLEVADSRFTWKVDKGRFKDLLNQLFSKGGRQLVLLLDRDLVIENLKLTDLTFDDALRALLLLGNGDFSTDGKTYTIFEVQRRDLLKQYLTNIILPFEYISSADFLRLLPQSLNSGTVFRIDDKANKLVLSGSAEEIQPIWDFFKLVDRPNLTSNTVRVDLQWIKTDEFLPLLPSEFAGFGPVALPTKNGFLIGLPVGKRAALEAFRLIVDRPVPVTPIHLKYLKADDLFAKLPPSVTEANLVKSTDPTLVFFKGNAGQLQNFRTDLLSIDLPRPLLRYEVLVLQFKEGNGGSLGASYSSKPDPTNTNSFTGSLGPTGSRLLSFNFDVIGSLGIGFSMNLAASLSENNAKVVADTTLNALSGEKITFQNTTTTRYKDASSEIDPATGKAASTPVIHELPSGLVLNLEGWISSDNMITLKVDSTLSEATKTSADSTVPPDTTEKKISTLVRTPSGKPVVIGGLKQEKRSLVTNKIPFLGDIPWLGLLFQSRDETVERTEFSLYIVPILDRPEWPKLSDEAKAREYYKRFHPGTP